MNTYLLIFFAIPIAVIIFSIVFQRIIRCPFLVAGIVFSVFLVATFAIGNLNILILTIAYTIISFITAYITRYFSRNNNSGNSSCGCNRRNLINQLGCNRR